LNTFVDGTLQTLCLHGTPLKTACVYRDSKAVEWMLDHGADVNHIPVRGDGYANFTPNYTALNSSVVSQVQLKAWNRSYHPTDIDMKDTKCLELLIKKGVDVNRRSVGGMAGGITATMYAAAIGNAPALRLLLDNGADVNVSIEVDDPEDAEDIDAEEIEEMIDEYWSNLGLQKPAKFVSATQYSAVQMAADAGHEECVQMLIAKGAKYTP
jgi:ankyrin repeat protein